MRARRHGKQKSQNLKVMGHNARVRSIDRAGRPPRVAGGWPGHWPAHQSSHENGLDIQKSIKVRQSGVSKVHVSLNRERRSSLKPTQSDGATAHCRLHRKPEPAGFNMRTNTGCCSLRDVWYFYFLSFFIGRHIQTPHQHNHPPLARSRPCSCIHCLKSPSVMESSPSPPLPPSSASTGSEMGTRRPSTSRRIRTR